ncbi:hypothetical protein VTL71DRAFT_3101 [Oculimacula yallundae]|uniref:Uncharacterized protein n=1 Tax=Oculimacula yallundae TaxID=86028 RepID=A0ABR4C814_9HELO
MGLIKTAMMTGGGIYAVKQLAKTSERRHDNKNYNNNNGSQSSREGGYQNQPGYWGPGPGPQGQGQQGPSRPYYQDQREYSSYNQNPDSQYATRGPGPYGPNERDSYNQDSYDQKRSYRDEDYQYQYQQRGAGQPPSYYPDQGQQQQQQGYVNQNGYQEESSRGGGGSGGGASDMAGLAGMAMEFAGGNEKRGDKAGKMMKGFLGK